MLTSPGGADITVESANGHTSIRFSGRHDHDRPRLEVDVVARTLMLWGRRPPPSLVPEGPWTAEALARLGVDRDGPV